MLATDLTYAVRGLRRSPGFAAVAILTLALGIGANTAMFSVVDAVLLRPLPFPHPEQLVYAWTTDLHRGTTQGSDSYPDFRDWRAQSGARAPAASSVFSGLSAVGFADYNLTGAGDPIHVAAINLSANAFSMLRVQPALGRAFRPGEDRPGAVAGADAVILSDALWRAKFGAAPGAIGRRVELDGRNYQVVGVMPPGFVFPIGQGRIDLWTTIAPRSVGDSAMTEQRDAGMFWVVGRLRDGVSLPQAQERLAAVQHALDVRYGDTNAYVSVRLVPAQRQLTGDIQPILLILFGAVGCVLLIACVNVANLTLARGTARRREIALRAALGAGRRALLRYLLAESLLLGLLGGAAGLMLAWWGTSLLLHLAPADIPRLAETSASPLVLVFALGLGLLTGLLFGLFPALGLARTPLTTALNEAGRGGVESRRQRRWRGALVVAEIGLALVLLISAGLLTASFARLAGVSPGFDPAHALTATVNLPDTLYSDAQQSRFYDRLLDQLRAQPGVLAAGGIAPLPFTDNELSVTVNLPTHPLPPGDQPIADFSLATDGYFRAMAIPLLGGRDFSPADQPNAPQVVIVNEAFARHFFPGRDALGELIQPGISNGGTPPARRIVGIVGDAKLGHPRQPADPMIYLPESQVAFTRLSVVLRAAGDPAGLAGTLRAAVRRLDPNLPVYDVRAMSERVEGALADARFDMSLLALYAGLALVLAAIGLYALMAQLTAQRTREIGVRMALGARPGDVLRLVVREGLLLALAGTAVGFAVAWATSRLLAKMLYGISGHDPLVYAGIAVFLLLVAIAACWLPARRAARVDPMVALRYE